MKVKSALATLVALPSLASATSSVSLNIESSNETLSGQVIRFGLWLETDISGAILQSPADSFTYEPTSMDVYKTHTFYGVGSDGGSPSEWSENYPVVAFKNHLVTIAIHEVHIGPPKHYESTPAKIKDNHLTINGSDSMFYVCPQEPIRYGFREMPAVFVFSEEEAVPGNCTSIKIAADVPHPVQNASASAVKGSTNSTKTSSRDVSNASATNSNSTALALAGGDGFSTSSSRSQIASKTQVGDKTKVNSPTANKTAPVTESTKQPSNSRSASKTSQASSSQSTSATQSQTKNGGAVTVLPVAGFLAAGAALLL